MSVLHASAKSAEGRGPPRPARVCPECGAPLPSAAWRQLFCSPAHKAAFHNRQTVRGRTLTPLVIADRITRGGSRGDVATGRSARNRAQRLMDRWAAEDRDAGRISMVDYVRLRSALGYEQ